MQHRRTLTCNLPHKLGRTLELRPLITAGTAALIHVLWLTNGLSHSPAQEERSPSTPGTGSDQRAFEGRTPGACVGMTGSAQTEVQVRSRFPKGDIASWLFGDLNPRPSGRGLRKPRAKAPAVR